MGKSQRLSDLGQRVALCIKDVAIFSIYRTWRLEFEPANFAFSSWCSSSNVGFQFLKCLAFSHWVLLRLQFALIGTSWKALEAIAAVVTLDMDDGQAHTHPQIWTLPRATKPIKNAGRFKIIAVLLILLRGCFLVQQGQIQRSGFSVSAESPKRT